MAPEIQVERKPKARLYGALTLGGLTVMVASGSDALYELYRGNLGRGIVAIGAAFAGGLTCEMAGDRWDEASQVAQGGDI